MSKLVVFLGLSIVQAGTLQVRDRTVLTETRAKVTLGDIATFDGVGPGDEQVLRSVVIGNAPKDGEKRVFTRYAMIEILRGPLHEHPMKSVIPERIEVLSRFHPAHPDRLKQQILDYYRSQTRHKIEVRDFRSSIPLTDATRSVRLEFRAEVPRGGFTLPVRLGEGAETHWVSGVITLRDDVPVLLRSIGPGEILGPQDYVIEGRDVTHLNDGLPSSRELNGASVARPLAKGMILSRSVLQRPKVLQSGDPVRIILGGQDWSVSVSGVAQQAGSIGDRVRVVNSNTNKIFTGLVVDKGVVEVQ